MKTTEERFWSKVDKTDTCWLWTKGLDNNGFGQAHFNGAKEKAHRLAYKLVHKDIGENIRLKHDCKNKRCVNPAHLNLIVPTTIIRDGEVIRTCSSCKEDKPIREFARNRAAQLGREYWCYPCKRQKHKLQQRKHYKENINKERERSRLKAKTLTGQSRQIFRNALAGGKVKRFNCCADCKTNNGVMHGHHEDYNKPLDVIWLCSFCHGKRHRQDYTNYDKVVVKK